MSPEHASGAAPSWSELGERPTARELRDYCAAGGEIPPDSDLARSLEHARRITAEAFAALSEQARHTAAVAVAALNTAAHSGVARSLEHARQTTAERGWLAADAAEAMPGDPARSDTARVLRKALSRTAEAMRTALSDTAGPLALSRAEARAVPHRQQRKAQDSAAGKEAEACRADPNRGPPTDPQDANKPPAGTGGTVQKTSESIEAHDSAGPRAGRDTGPEIRRKRAGGRVCCVCSGPLPAGRGPRGAACSALCSVQRRRRRRGEYRRRWPQAPRLGAVSPQRSRYRQHRRAAA